MSWSNYEGDISKQRNSFHIEPLKGEENYELWSIRTSAMIASKGNLNYITIRDYNIVPAIEGGEPNVSPPESIQTASLIKLLCADGPLLQVQHIDRPYEIWLALKNLYSPKGFSSEFLLCRELFSTTLKNCDNSMGNYLNQVKRLNDQLRAKNITIPDKVIFAWVLNNLSSEYETLITTITQSIRVNGSDDLRLDSLFANLIDESKRLTSRNGDSVALYANTKGKKPKNTGNIMGNHRITKPKGPKCPHCKKTGHKIEKCWFAHPELRPKPKPKQASGEEQVEQAMTALHVNNEIDDLDFDVAPSYVTELNYPETHHVMYALNRTQFILDSGATTHICCESSYFTNLKDTSAMVSWSKIKRIKASGIGDVPIIFHDTNTKAILKNCLFVPEFDVNLISVDKLLKNDYKIIFDKFCEIYSSSRNLISKTSACNGLYIFPIISNTHEIFTSVVTTAEDKINLWHARMGHIGKNALMQLKFQNDENIFHRHEINLICEECILAKATKHINHEISESKTFDFLELVRSDLFGPVNNPSFGNKKYFITFLDDYTKFLVVELLNTKDQATKAWQNFVLREQRFSGKKIKIYRTDNGTEFFEISKICKENGIIHENTAPYAHEQAGGAERINLTLLNKVRAMLFTAKLDKRFWAEALIAAVYLYNRTPHTSLNYKTPYEIKYKTKPKINNIKIWGSLAYSLNYKAKKLDPRAKPSILIGYGSNQYKLLELSTGRAFWSRDTEILEGVFLDKIQKTPENFLLQEIYSSNLVDIRNSAKNGNISFRGDAKNRTSEISDKATRNTSVSKITDLSCNNSTSNELISPNAQNASNASNATNEQNAQKLIPASAKNTLKSRELAIYDNKHMANSDKIQSNLFDRNTAGQELNLRKRKVANSNSTFEPKAQNKFITGARRMLKLPNTQLYNRYNIADYYFDELENYDDTLASNNTNLRNLQNVHLQNAQNKILEDGINSVESRDAYNTDQRHANNSNIFEIDDSDELNTHDDLFINRNFANKTQSTPTLQNSHNSQSQNTINDIFDDSDELAMILLINHENFNDPKTYNQAMTSPNSEEWQLAMDKEIDDLSSQNTWSLVIPPPDANIIDGRWVYKTKLNSDGTINKYKARYVAKGFQQTYGIDFEETFSNTVKPMVFRILFAFAAWNDLEIQQWDIKSAFPNASLKNKIYMKQPKGYENKNIQLVCLLNKALYGLKQSAREFYLFLAELLSQFGFITIIADQSVFYNPDTKIIITAHIDDLLVFSDSMNEINILKAKISKKVEISDLGDARFFLGMELSRNRKNKSLFLSQAKYIQELLNKFNVIGEKPIYSPTIQGIRLEKNPDQASEHMIKLYQQQIGSLMYLMTATRPDLAFSVSNCARYMSNPSEEHYKALNRIWQYVRTTQNKGLLYNISDEEALSLIGYVDSDWGGDYTTRKSTTGYLFTFGNTPISWSSKLQKSVAISFCEAEYMALKEAAKELIWLKTVFNEIKPLNKYNTDLLYCDNKSAIDLSKNPEHHARTKHIDIQYHFVRDYIERKIFELRYINTKEQLADALTKAIDINAFRNFTKRINIVENNKN